MALFDRLFSAPQAIDKTIDALVSTGDALFFTDEERSKANLQLLDAKIEFYRATQGSRLARRVIAFILVGTWIAMIAFGLLMRTLGNIEISDHAYNVASDVLSTPVSLVISFYFATSMIGAVRK